MSPLEAASTWRKDAMECRNVILHHHIFKNAGTSFNKALEGVFGDRFMEFDGDNANHVFEPNGILEVIRSNPNTAAFSTHQGMLFPGNNAELEVISTLLLRHPLSRISSIYQFERIQEAENAGAQMAKQLSFGAYLRWRWEQSPAFFCSQALYCARSPGQMSYRPTETLLDRATQNLNLVNCVGTVEQYPDFLSRVQKQLASLGEISPLVPFRVNTSRAPSDNHDLIRTKIISETDEAFFEQLAPVINIDVELWTVFNKTPIEKSRT